MTSPPRVRLRWYPWCLTATRTPPLRLWTRHDVLGLRPGRTESTPGSLTLRDPHEFPPHWRVLYPTAGVTSPLFYFVVEDYVPSEVTYLLLRPIVCSFGDYGPVVHTRRCPRGHTGRSGLRRGLLHDSVWDLSGPGVSSAHVGTVSSRVSLVACVLRDAPVRRRYPSRRTLLHPLWVRLVLPLTNPGPPSSLRSSVSAPPWSCFPSSHPYSGFLFVLGVRCRVRPLKNSFY